MIENSGEIPEVTLHESLYFLVEDEEGPGLQVKEGDMVVLRQAVVQRYRSIILRDLDPDNRDRSIYRGLARCVANWERLQKFCSGQDIDHSAILDEAAVALKEFFCNEINDVKSGKRASCVNCCQEEIEKLAESLSLSSGDLPEGWQELCPPR